MPSPRPSKWAIVASLTIVAFDFETAPSRIQSAQSPEATARWFILLRKLIELRFPDSVVDRTAWK